MITDKMSCPYCHASNQNLSSKSRSSGSKRGYAGWVSYDSPEPNIILHPDCQKRIVGSLSSPEGLQVRCEGCSSVFNCWTGNIDEGEHVISTEKPIEKRREEAKEYVRKLEEKEKEQEYQKVVKFLRERGVSYYSKNGSKYIQFLGSVWKLSENDIDAISKDTWDTKNTIVIEQSLLKRNIKTVYLSYVIRRNL